MKKLLPLLLLLYPPMLTVVLRVCVCVGWAGGLFTVTPASNSRIHCFCAGDTCCSASI